MVCLYFEKNRIVNRYVTYRRKGKPLQTPETAKPRETLHHQRSRETREVILQAAIGCLDEYGYSETTFAKVQTAADVSRGAITHHFPTKQALVAETARLLLENVMRPFERRQANPRTEAEPVHDLIMHSWKRMVASREGRAFVEILVACRTDRVLQDMLRDGLTEFDRRSGASITRLYDGHGPDADDAALLWAIFRSFCRGLIIHQQFVSSPDDIHRLLARFAQIMEKELFVRDPPASENPRT